MLHVSLSLLAAARLIRNRLDPCVSLQFAHITRHIISVIHILHSVYYRSLQSTYLLVTTFTYAGLTASHVVS